MGSWRFIISASQEWAYAEVEVKGIVTFLESDMLFLRDQGQFAHSPHGGVGLTHKLCHSAPFLVRALPTNPLTR